MPENARTASGSAAKLPEVVNALQDSSNVATEINLSIGDEKRRLQEEHQRLREENRQKEDELKELEAESIATLNDAFDVLKRFSDVIEADDFIEDSRRRIDQARPNERTPTILDVLRSTSTLIDVIGSRWREQ
jgi:hypothetical protein